MQRDDINYKQDSTIFLSYSSFSASDDVYFAPCTAFPLSRDIFDESSQRLVVFYIPRLLFQLNRCSHIKASFGSDDLSVQVEQCGIRLVHKQDVSEFVQTLVQYMLRSSDAYHQYFSVNLMHQLQVLKDCNHEKDYCCHFSQERWSNSMPKLLLSNGTIQEERTSREILFSNHAIAAGTSNNSSQGSNDLGRPFVNGHFGSEISSCLECWYRPYLQEHHPVRNTYNHRYSQSEIPAWFKHHSINRSVKISLPLNLCNNPDWMGFAFCAVFSFQKHPASVPMKSHSRFSFVIVCHLRSNLGCMNPLLWYGITEEDVIISLRQREFLWISFIPCEFLSPKSKWSRCNSVEFSFVSDNSDVLALKCGVDLVFWENLEFTRTMLQCITSYGRPSTSNERFPFNHPNQFSSSDGSSGTSGHYSYEYPYQICKIAALDRCNNRSIFNQCIPRSEIVEWFGHDLLPSDLSPKFDFHPSTSYNFCFPPSKIQDWFSHPNHGHSMTIDLPSNLYHNRNWMGLVLYASFSIHGDPNIIISNLVSGKSHFLYCQCQTSMANVDNQTIAFSTNKEEITWLLNLGEFIWICYIPGEPFKNMLPHCTHIEASFVSDWPGVIVQNCALQLLYQHDQVQFEQELKHCNNLISQKWELVHKQVEDQKKINEQYHVDEGLQRIIFSNIDFEVKIFPRLIDQLETDETETQLGQSDLLENQEMVDKWSVTTKEVTKISGQHLEKSCTEFEFIQRVIKEISSTISNHGPLFVAKHPVGIDIRAKAIELLLDMESNDVCMVGICGFGGIGKTTISKEVYNRIAHRFEGSCFLENVRERSKINGDIIQLQETLLSKILRDRDLKVHNVFEGNNLIKKRLHSKKVLLVLDDVEDFKEVENLLGECDWFASGSRVIITTRDRHVLTSLGRDPRIYEVTKLSQCEALELFNRHAFQTSKYGEDYLELAEQITSYADGLPLALEIIGSDLRGKNIYEWKSALQKYENIPHKDIQEILKISYDELEETEKEIFLDIAYFFKGYNMGEVVNILDSCDLYPDYGIGKLIDKCLVTLECGHLSMHDLVQQMGREIDQQESKELQQHSRIWRYKDAHKLLTGNMGSNKIRGIMLCSPEPTKIALEANVFKRMKNLKFLIGNVHIGEALEYLPDELRVLEWHEFPLSLSSKCCLPRELVVLKMSESNIILENVVKQGFQNQNLKVIGLESCEFITKLPDLCCPNLEELDLGDCKNLIEVHESFGFLQKLKVWNLYSCSQLQILPRTLMLKSLKVFKLYGCKRLEKFPDIHPEMKCLYHLDLDGCGIRELPSSLLYLTGLVWFFSRRCCKLANFLVGANKSQMREEEDIPSAKLRLPCNSFNNFSGPTGFLCLTELHLSQCPGIKDGLDSWMQPDYFPVLTYLWLYETGIVTIPESISRFTTLRQLIISNCKKLREIPRLPQSIRTVDAQNCDRLDTQSSSRLLNQFREILVILPNTVAEAATSFDSEWPTGDLILPVTEIPEWLKFNHHQSVGNSVSFLVGPKISNLVVCIAFPSKDVPNYLDDMLWRMWYVHISINGKTKSLKGGRGWRNGNYDHLWLLYWKVNISNPSEKNRVVVEVISKECNLSLNRMRIYVECNCCPQKPNKSPASSMDQCAFNNGEEDSGHVRIRRRLRRRNHRPTHARHPQKHYLGWLRVRYQLWKRSSKPWRRIITNGFHDQGSSSILNTFLNDDTNANLYPPSKKTKTC